MCKSPLKSKNFRYLFAGETVSNIGDQFTFIALPWLVLKLSDDPAVLGLILGLAGIPRALFMLVGGAVTDRFSAKTIMQVSNLFRLLLVALLAVLTLTSHVEIWMLYILSFCFGVADAFFAPAQTAMVPSTVDIEGIDQANMFVYGSIQLSQFVGPALVGILIGSFDKGSSSLTGVGIAFALDAATFLISLATLGMIKHKEQEVSEHENVLHAIKGGFGYVWSNIGLRYVLLVIGAVNFLIVGPLVVGMPVIAKNQLSGATAYGSIMSAWGIGTLIGYAVSGSVPPPRTNVSVLLLSLTALMGVGLAFFGFLDKTIHYVITCFLMALSSGYVSLTFMNWLQKSTPKELMGRVMSILMFFAVGLIPISQALSGWLFKLSQRGLFVCSGGLLVISATIVLMIPAVRALGQEEQEPA